MNYQKLTLALGLLFSPTAFAYDAQDCAKYVIEKKYPASYCLLTNDQSPEIEAWLEQLRKVPGPIYKMDKYAVEDSGCDEQNCGLSSFTVSKRVVLDQGNDSMGGGSRIRYFISLSQGKQESVVYTVDVSQDFDMLSDTSIRKVGKIQKFID